MKYYDLEFDEQVEELDTLLWSLQNIIHEVETDNPFYIEILDLTNRVYDEKKKTEERMPKDNTNKYLLNEYKRSVM
jgi:predicted nucleotidyltransferase